MRLQLLTRISLFLILIPFFLTLNCVTFLEEEEKVLVKNYEKGTYTIKRDVNVRDQTLKKNQKIKLFIICTDESIKVYGYPAEISILKSERVLILYLFEDDFKDTRYNKAAFEKKLFETIQR